MRFWILLVFMSFSILGNGQIGESHFLTPNLYGPYRVADMDNDGDLDYVTISTYYPNAQDRIITWFENVDGLGTDWATHPIEVATPGYVFERLILSDITNDGWIDILMPDYALIHNGDISNIDFTSVALPHNDLDDCGDLDGDGDNDLVTANWGAGTLEYHLNQNQDGTFGNTVQFVDLIPGESYHYHEAMLIDMDQDTDLDLVTSFEVPSQSNYYITWYENDGSGNFSNPNLILSTSIASNSHLLDHYFQIGDFNGDAKMDVLLSISGRGLDLYYQITGTVWNHQFINTNGGAPASIADFDNDGDLDFFTGRYLPGNIYYWYENINNTDNFVKRSIPNYLELAGRMESQLGDFDNDGDIDISLINLVVDSYNGIFLIENDLTTTANFSTFNKISDNIGGFIKPFPVDIDDDLDNDLIIFSEAEEEHYWLENLDSTNDFSLPHLLISDEGILTSEVKDLDSDGDSDIIGINDNGELVWYENNSTTSVQFGSKQIISSNVLSKALILGDLDNDGDYDIGVHRSPDGAILWYEQDGTGSFTAQVVSNLGLNTEMLHFGDFNNDGLKDILYKNVVSQEDQLSYLQQEVDGTFTSVLVYEGSVEEVEISDFENDFDIDIVVKYDEGNGFLLKMLHNESGSFNEEQITFSPQSFGWLNDFTIVDVDNDGKKDIYFGVAYYKQLVDAVNFSPYIDFGGEGWWGIVETADLSGDGIIDLLSTAQKDALVWDENLLSEGAWVEGQVALDFDENCLLDSTGMNDWLLSFEINGETYFTSTNQNGYYAAFLPEGGDYIANVIPPNAYWTSCIIDTLINVDSLAFLDFPIQIEHECPLMQVEVSSSNLRPCMDGTVSIEYCNDGTITADSAQVEVVLEEFLLFNSANLPYTETDSSFIFDVGDIDIFECGLINISVTPDCDSTEVGDIVCATAYVTPDSLCVPINSLWDGSSIETSGYCENDTVYFEIENIGNGNMSESRQFRVEIANDDIVLLIIADTFQLESGEKKFVNVPSEMEVLRIEADQDQNHPLLSASSALVTDCANFEIPPDLFAVYSGSPFSSTFCRALSAAYDPNIKTVIPKGYGEENFIDREWELEYTIHFQNTGNDTAFNVVLKDIISPFLDLSSLRIGASSHSFDWSLKTDRELSFSFNNILLPDSTTNEVESHGYVQFFISPLSDAPFGTLIENRADIYFDFNLPIATNKTSQTIRMPIFATSEHLEVCEGEEFQSVIILEDQTIIDSTLTSEGLYLDFYYVTMLPSSMQFIDVDVSYGTSYLGVEITQDTVLEEVLTATNGCDSIIFHNISTIVSTQELEETYGLILYPQPVTDILNIIWNEQKGNPSSYSIMTSDGRLLEQTNILNNEINNPMEISMKNLANGVYWLRLDFEEGNAYFRIMKM